MGRETYDFYVEVTGVTSKAIQILEYPENQWLPKSQVECLDKNLAEVEEGNKVRIMIQEWLAREKGMI